MRTVCQLPTWRRVVVGTGLVTAWDFCDALRLRNMWAQEWAISLMVNSSFWVARKQTVIDLVMVTPADLGLEEKKVEIGLVYRRAQIRFGLSLCPPEVGPQYRLQFPTQAREEWYSVAMKPIVDYMGRPSMFRIEHFRTGLCLAGFHGDNEAIRYNHCRFIFAKNLPKELVYLNPG